MRNCSYLSSIETLNDFIEKLEKLRLREIIQFELNFGQSLKSVASKFQNYPILRRNAENEFWQNFMR